jgi:hypothetical protein
MIERCRSWVRYNFPYFIKTRARRGRAPPLRRGLPPVFAPLAAPGGALGGCGHEAAVTDRAMDEHVGPTTRPRT